MPIEAVYFRSKPFLAKFKRAKLTLFFYTQKRLDIKKNKV